MTARTMEERIYDIYKDDDWKRDLAAYYRIKAIKDQCYFADTKARMQIRMDEIKARWPANLHHHFDGLHQVLDSLLKD